MVRGNTLRIVAADDDRGILKIIERVLGLNDFMVFTATNGTDALRMVDQMDPSLVLLDVMMPGMTGIEVCEKIRSHSNVPVIILTGLDDESDATRALEAGADDYIRKPFGANELVARIRAVLRRAQIDVPRAERIEVGPLIVDEGEYQAFAAGVALDLSRTEFRLLGYLVRNRNRVLTHDQILERVWGAEYLGSHHVLRVAISRLRQKLEASGVQAIETLSGIGYRFRVDTTGYAAASA
jgi:DNA-binding response OmpR family regulator